MRQKFNATKFNNRSKFLHLTIESMDKRKQFSLLLTVCFILCGTNARAQLLNSIFEQKDSLIPGDTQTLRLHAELFNYYRNTEYFDLIEKGQTFFGSMFQAHLSFQPHNNVLLKAGFQTRQDFGSTGFISVQPVFCISFFKHKWRYNFGMLQGSTNYGFIEPMYNIDRAITHRVENGIQGIYKSRLFYFNNFLVWHEPTYRTSTNQERFTTGFTADRTLLKSNKLSISLPFQGTLAHRGGQLNGNPTPIFSRVNTAIGLKMGVHFSNDLNIRTEHYWLHSADFSPNITQPYKNGNASWHTLSFSKKGFELMLNYWAGREYQSPVGTQIYNNYNFYNVYEFRRVRHMFMSRIMYTQALHRNLLLDLRLEPFYDQEYGRFQYSYSAYIRINLGTRLGKLKME